MEATSDYWKPVLFTLEREGTECVLYQASRVKADGPIRGLIPSNAASR